MILLIIHGKYSTNFPLMMQIWKDSLTCKLVGVLMGFAMQMSLMSTCVMALERFIIIHFPFQANTYLQHLFIPSLLSWTLPLLMALLKVLHFSTVDAYCFYVTSKSYTIKTLLILSIYLLMEVATFTAIAVLSVLALYAIFKAKLKLTRHLTMADKSYIQTILISTLTCFIQLTSNLAYVTMNVTGISTSSFIHQLWSVGILQITAIINPITYTARSPLQYLIAKLHLLISPHWSKNGISTNGDGNSRYV